MTTRHKLNVPVNGVVSLSKQKEDKKQACHTGVTQCVCLPYGTPLPPLPLAASHTAAIKRDVKQTRWSQQRDASFLLFCVFWDVTAADDDVLSRRVRRSRPRFDLFWSGWRRGGKGCDAAVRMITREKSVCQRRQTEAEGLISQSRHVGTYRTSDSCHMFGGGGCSGGVQGFLAVAFVLLKEGFDFYFSNPIAKL